MKCLCCGKSIDESASDDEKKWQWHKRCIRKFFGTTRLPEIDLAEEKLQMLVNQSVRQGLTVPGVQKKLSLHLESVPDARLTIVNYPTGYILKPQTKEYPNLPEYEQMAMLMAERAGIQTVPHALIYQDHVFSYITKRVDRSIGRDKTELFAMEDFCQLSGRLTEDKYKGSYENCGKIIRQFSSYPGYDMSEMFLRILFSYVIGNSDMHLKNFSLLEEQPSSRRFRLSPAYDMLPVNAILKADPDEMALTVHGKRRNIRRKDFLALADSCGIPPAAARHMTEMITEKEKVLLEECEQSFLSMQAKEQVSRLIRVRIQNLS